MDDNTIPEPSLEESIQLLLSQVPTPVHDFVLNDLQGKAQELMERYQLHVDQGGVLERELLLMLLGQEQPVDFMTTLEETGIPSETVSSLITDINEEIFMKLREKEDSTLIQQPASVTPTFQTAPAPAFIPTPVMATPIAPIAAAPTVAVPAPQQKIINRISIPEPVTRPTTPVVQSRPSRVIEPPALQPAVVPTPVVAPQTQATPPAPQRSAPPSENRGALHDLLKSYGVDPYREPAE